MDRVNINSRKRVTAVIVTAAAGIHPEREIFANHMDSEGMAEGRGNESDRVVVTLPAEQGLRIEKSKDPESFGVFEPSKEREGLIDPNLTAQESGKSYQASSQ